MAAPMMSSLDLPRGRSISTTEMHTWALVDDEQSSATQAAQGPTNAGEDSARPDRAVNIRDLDETQLQELWPHGDGVRALFLDYDGTLREFEARPELAQPTAKVHELLAALSARQDLRVYILSGRDAAFLRAHLATHERLILIAEHERRVAGRFQVWRPDSPCSPDVSLCWKQLIRPELEAIVAQTEGSQLEEKESALVFHHRGVLDTTLGNAAAERLVEQVERLREESGGPLRDVKTSLGQRTVEVSCRGVSKGEVMRRICHDWAAAHGPFRAVLAAGDDVSDESMFVRAPRDCLTVKVGAATTRARFRVDSPKQLRELLWRIVAR